MVLGRSLKRDNCLWSSPLPPLALQFGGVSSCVLSTRTWSLQSCQVCLDLPAQAVCLRPRVNAVWCSVSPGGFLCAEGGRRGAEAQLASCGSSCVYSCAAVSQVGTGRVVCWYSKLWHLNGCHAASSGTARSMWGRWFKLSIFQP